MFLSTCVSYTRDMIYLKVGDRIVDLRLYYGLVMNASSFAILLIEDILFFILECRRRSNRILQKRRVDLVPDELATDYKEFLEIVS